jgi:putative ABC transport system ATP-binding protein
MSDHDALVQVREVRKQFRVGDDELEVLRGISLDVRRGELLAITGPSGNGKSTLLNLIAGIDRPSSGEVLVGGQPIHRLSEEQLARWRGTELGVVFQFFQLLPALSLLQNVVLPMDFVRRLSPPQRRVRAMELLATVGLADQAHKLPSQVSGGQQQRAAIARALANDPPLIVADEPTGNLDARLSDEVFQLFLRLVGDGKTLIMVTHNPELARQAHRVVELINGQVVRDGPPDAQPDRRELDEVAP